MGHETTALTNSVIAEVADRGEFQESDGAAALAELQALLAQFGEEIVESPRLPGVPLPLQALINACPEPPTEKNAAKFLAEAHSLLAAARAKKPEEQEETDEESETEDSKGNPELEAAKKKLT
jgi:hypothetical protein